jgi:outer membrane protein
MITTFVLLSLFVGADRAQAQARESLTLTEAVGRALATHPSVTAAAMGLDRASADVRDAESARLPSVLADASAIHFGDAMVVAPLHGFNPQLPPTFDRTLMQSSISLSYSLFDAGRGARIDRTLALESAAEAGVDAARQALIAQTVNAWLAVRGAREVVAAHDAGVAALERERDRSAQLFESGRAARVIMLRAEATLSAARAERVTETADLDAAERELARFLGIAVENVTGRVFPAVELAPASRQIDRAALLERASSGNAGIARSRRQVDAAQAAGAAARALWYPRVQLSGRLVEYASGAGHESAEWQGGAQLSYPLFTGGARGAAAQRAVAELGAARAELALAELRVADGIDRAIAVWNAANGRVEALEASVAQMEEVTRIERLALDAGAGVQTDYLVSEADLLRARASLTEARQAAVSARIQLALITGELSGPWLANNVETTQ